MSARSALLRAPRAASEPGPKLGPKPSAKSGTMSEERPAPRPVGKAKPRLFHARMLVTRLEEWCVEAESVEQARALLTAGAGHRCTPGESIQVEVDSVFDE